MASGPTLRLPAVGLEDAGDYVCRAEPGLSGLGGGAAEARLTVNGEKAALPSGPHRSWDKSGLLVRELNRLRDLRTAAGPS